MSHDTYELIQVPLVEATIEVRFAGDARIDAIRGEFQQAIVDHFPLLYVPEIDAGESPALIPYRFQNKDGTRTLALAIHSLAYLSQQYPGWEAFRTEFMSYWSELVTRVAPRRLSRIGVRFVNRFDSELAKNLDLDSAPAYLAPLRSHECSFHRSATNYSQDTIDLLVNVHRPEDEGVLTLDYDAYTRNVSLDSLEETLNTLHDRAEEEFLRALDDGYKQTLSSPKAGG